MKTLSAVAELLVQVRKKRGLSQKDMYMLIGMSQQQYQRVESGQDLKVSTLLRIFSGLGLELTVTDPSYLDTQRDSLSDAEQGSIWTKKHQHLED
jgi:transcriptional regulator with XRE-family HTH domain